MYLNFECVASLVMTGMNSIDLGRPTMASYKSCSFKNVCTMLRTGVTLERNKDLLICCDNTKVL